MVGAGGSDQTAVGEKSAAETVGTVCVEKGDWIREKEREVGKGWVCVKRAKRGKR